MLITSEHRTFFNTPKKGETGIAISVQIIARYSQEREKVMDLTSPMAALIKAKP